MKALGALIILTAVAWSSGAQARLDIRCFDEAAGKQWTFRTPDVQLERASGERTFELRTKAGEIFDTLKLTNDDPIEPRLASVQTGVKCRVVAGGSEVFEKLIDDGKTRDLIAKWNAWVSAQAPACDEELGSKGYFRPGASKIAVVFHGYSSNPKRMSALIKLFWSNGYNVLVPKLARHFTNDLRELDQSDRHEWYADADEVFEIARGFSPKVALGGYSLGGALASRLALANGALVDRMVLLAPAWRLRWEVEGAIHVGDAFDVNLSDLTGREVKCTENAGHASAAGGIEVRRVGKDLEKQFESLMHDADAESVFETIRVPHLVFASSDDEVVDEPEINDICDRNSRYCIRGEAAPASHVKTLDRLNRKSINEFLRYRFP